MKKTLLVAVSLCALTLAWCGCDCPEKVLDPDTLDEATQYCLDNGWTHSYVISPDEEYWECFFPSWIGCRDDLVLEWWCDFQPNTDDIDTEEERLAGCEENVQSWMEDFEEWSENINVEWGEESEGGASFVRNGVVTYTKDGVNMRMNAECVADFVDGSLSVSYDEAVEE